MIRRFTKREESGFTLIELLTVIVIIGILAAIGIGVFSAQKARARDAQVTSDVRNIVTAVESNSNYIDSGKVPTYTDLKNDGVKATPGVSWGISSNTSGYCIIGYNPLGKQYTTETSALVFDSSIRVLGKKGTACDGSTYVGSIVTVPATVGSENVCLTGGTLNGSTCNVPATSYSATATTTDTGGTYSCASPYSVSGSNCVQNNTTTYAGTYYSYANGGYYSCPSGGTLSGSTCTSSTRTYTQASMSYGSCPGGYEPAFGNAECNPVLHSGNCTAAEIGGAGTSSAFNANGKCYGGNFTTRPVYYTCYYPYWGNGTSQCYQDVTTSYNATYNTSYSSGYSCPNGGYASGSTCYNTTSTVVGTANYTPNNVTTYSCPSGGTRSGTTCNVAATSYPATSRTTYTCPTGTGWTLDSTTKLCSRQDA